MLRLRNRRTLFQDLARGFPAMVLLSNGAEAAGLLADLAIDTPHKRGAKVRVALADFDSSAGFLPDLAEKANQAQSYYDFDLVYLPFPTGTVIQDRFPEYPGVPRLYVPQLEGCLADAPQQLGVDVVCGLTKCLIANEELSDLFTSPHKKNPKVRFISTFGVRGYAKEAGTSFAKATFYLCLAELLVQDERWKLDYHDETAGCPLDYCDDRDDLTVGLKTMKFEHPNCRDKVRDPEMLKAFDTLLALELDTEMAAAEAR